MNLPPQFQQIQVEFIGWSSTQPDRLVFRDRRFGVHFTKGVGELEGEGVIEKAIGYLKSTYSDIEIHSFTYDNPKYNIQVSFKGAKIFRPLTKMKTN